MSHTRRYSGPERRGISPESITRRARFVASLELLAYLGLSAGAMEYYRRLARKKRVLPHELVRDVAEKVATPEASVLTQLGLDPLRPL